MIGPLRRSYMGSIVYLLQYPCRGPDFMGWRYPPRIDVSPFAIIRGITTTYPDLQGFRLLGINSARGLSTQRSLWHPSYMVLGESSLQRFELRPHGIVEVQVGGTFCFPTVLPRYVNVGILSRFLTLLIPTGAAELHMHMTANGDPLSLELVECLCGFFIQICVTGREELLEDIQNALTMLLAGDLAKEVAAIFREVYTHPSKQLYDDTTAHLLRSNYWLQPIYQELLHSSSRCNATVTGERKRL